MKLEVIDVKICDLRSVLADPNVYVIRKEAYWNKEHPMKMNHITEVNVGDILFKKCVVVRLTSN